ncbi:protein of unknown function [Thiomonas sp. Sup16B3]|nr:hypothetical protein THICB3120045 [Thiomonas sp. CB3]VDY09356.1 protein of unknown function [Thiomonas sp. Sup16B3]VDY19066.1 protein of unknown function [Thiomonas sp. CB2]
MIVRTEATGASGERHHGGDLLQIAVMHRRGSTQVTLVLGGFFGQDMALERLTTFDSAARTHAESLCGTLFGFHLGHDCSVKYDISAGGLTMNQTLSSPRTRVLRHSPL